MEANIARMERSLSEESELSVRNEGAAPEGGSSELQPDKLLEFYSRYVREHRE